MLGEELLRLPQQQPACGDDQKLTNGTGWAPTAVAGPSAGWGNVELGGQGRFRWSCLGGKGRDVNPFALEETTPEVSFPLGEHNH